MLYAGGCAQFDQEISPWLALHVFSATFFTYNLHRSLSDISIDQINGLRYHLVKNNAGYTNTSLIISGLIAFVSFLLISRSAQFALLILGVISIGYVLPLVLKKRLRDLGNLKIILISMVWATIPILGIYHQTDIFTLLLFWAEHAFFIFALTIPFDIRDQHLDTKSRISNLANSMGVHRIKKLMMFILILSLLCAVFLFGTQLYSWQKFFVIVILLMYLFSVSARAEVVKGEWFYLFVLDGLIMVKGAINFL